MGILKQLSLAGALGGTLALGGCGTTTGTLSRGEQTWTLNASDKVPAAHGKVEVAAKGKDGNREIEIEVKSLALPAKVFQGTSAYVVWIKPEGGAPQNIGTLKLDDDLEGELKTKTPYKVFDVMVTAEHTPQTTLPSMNNEVFSTRVYVSS